MTEDSRIKPWAEKKIKGKDRIDRFKQSWHNTINRLGKIGRKIARREEAEKMPSKYWPKELKKYSGYHSVRRKSNFTFLLVRQVIREALHIYFSEIEAIGIENIPPDGSVMLVGNHPNALIDPGLLISCIRHPVANAAKDTFIKIPIFGWLSVNKLYFVPLARRMDEPSKSADEIEASRLANEEAFKLAKYYLGYGRIFNIYGEGRSTESRKLLSIKMGFMAIALEAERDFGYDLNLNIVPFGYFYPKRNCFRSQVALIFGKPFTIKKLVDMPEQVLSLNDEQIANLNRKIMFAGKKKVQKSIEEMIISIEKPEHISLIDDISAFYVVTPQKFMGRFGNIREKYILCKNIAQAIFNASLSDRGNGMIGLLRLAIEEYRTELEQSGFKDSMIRRRYRPFSQLRTFLALLWYVLLSPIAFLGGILFIVPSLFGRYGRHWALNVKKMPIIDGDEKSVLFGLAGFFIFLPFFCTGLAWFSFQLAGFLELGKILQSILAVISIPLGAIGLILLYRFCLWHWPQLNDSIRFFTDTIHYIFKKKNIDHLKKRRFSIIDTMDRIMADFL